MSAVPAHHVVARKLRVRVFMDEVPVNSFAIGISKGAKIHVVFGYNLHDDGVFTESDRVALRVG